MKRNEKRVFTTLSLFSFLALMPMSCNLFCASDSCGCEPSSKPQEIRIKSFATQLVNESNVEISESEINPYDQVFITLLSNEVEFKTLGSIESSQTWTFGTAFACSILPPTTENTLYLIQIINEKEFSSNDGTVFSPGENISALFGINYIFSSELTTIQNFIGPGLKLTQEDKFKIGLLQNPHKDLQLKFTIRLRFDDAQEFLITDQTLNVR